MNINIFVITLLLFIGSLSLIKPTYCSGSNNNTLTTTMLILATRPSINDYLKRRSARYLSTRAVNFTDNNITSSTNRMRIYEKSNNRDTTRRFSSKKKIHGNLDVN